MGLLHAPHELRKVERTYVGQHLACSQAQRQFSIQSVYNVFIYNTTYSDLNETFTLTTMAIKLINFPQQNWIPIYPSVIYLSIHHLLIHHLFIFFIYLPIHLLIHPSIICLLSMDKYKGQRKNLINIVKRSGAME